MNQKNSERNHKKNHSSWSQMSSHASVNFSRLLPRIMWSHTLIGHPFESRPEMKKRKAVSDASSASRQLSRKLLMPSVFLVASTATHCSSTCLQKVVIYHRKKMQACLVDIGAGVSMRSGQAGHNKSLPLPGLGALWPRGGWSISH